MIENHWLKQIKNCETSQKSTTLLKKPPKPQPTTINIYKQLHRIISPRLLIIISGHGNTVSVSAVSILCALYIAQ